MIKLLADAVWLSEILDELKLKHCSIGGIAIQHWGEPRVTRDVEVSVLVGFGGEVEAINRI